MFFGIIEHLGPMIPLVDDFVGKGLAPGMILIVVVMDLLHCPPGFFGSEAPQV